MVGWLYRFIVGRFEHPDDKWEIIHTATLIDGDFGTGLPVGVSYTMRNRRNGKIKIKNMT